jgi:hypothetical protein
MGEIKSASEIVKENLEKYPKARDDDRYLTMMVWYDDVSISDRFEVFSDKYTKGEIFSADSITRARRKLQEIHPELRGNLYEDRRAYVKEVIKDIATIN